MLSRASCPKCSLTPPSPNRTARRGLRARDDLSPTLTVSHWPRRRCRRLPQEHGRTSSQRHLLRAGRAGIHRFCLPSEHPRPEVQPSEPTQCALVTRGNSTQPDGTLGFHECSMSLYWAPERRQARSSELGTQKRAGQTQSPARATRGLLWGGYPSGEWEEARPFTPEVSLERRDKIYPHKTL